MVDIRYVRRTAQAKKGPFFSAQHFFLELDFFFQKFFFSNHHSSTTIKHHHIFLNIILQTHIFKVSTARLFRLGSVNARVGLIFFSDKCYFFFVFAVEVACWLKKNHKRNTFVSILFLFWFFEIGKIWTVNREYLGLSKGKKIIRQKKGIFNFFFFA